MCSRKLSPPFFLQLQIPRCPTIPLPGSTISFSSVAAVCDRRKFLATTMIFLQAAHPHLAFLKGPNAIRARQRGAHRRHDRNLLCERGVADDDFVLARDLAAWRVDDEVNVAVFHAVEHVRPTFAQL